MSHDISLTEDYLECPVCFNLMQEQIFQCKNGHSLCSSCSNICTKCPICNVSFTYFSNKIRNHTLEKVVEKYLKTLSETSSGINKNKSICNIKRCPIIKCTDKFYGSLTKHLKENHKIREITDFGTFVKLKIDFNPKIEYAQRLISAFKEIFLVNIKKCENKEFKILVFNISDKKRILFKLFCEPSTKKFIEYYREEFNQINFNENTDYVSIQNQIIIIEANKKSSFYIKISKAATTA